MGKFQNHNIFVVVDCNKDETHGKVSLKSNLLKQGLFTTQKIKIGFLTCLETFVLVVLYHLK